MSRVVPTQNLHRTSKLEARGLGFDILLLSVIFVVVIFVFSVIATNIHNDAAKSAVLTRASQTAERFHSHINKTLVLVQKTSNSNALKFWFSDEENQEKKEDAYYEMLDYSSVLPNPHLYFGIQNSLGDFSFKSGTTLDNFVPLKKLDPNAPGDDWYFQCTASDKEYLLNFDKDDDSKIWKLWLNHKVTVDSKIAGVFCAAIETGNLYRKLFADHDVKRERGFLIDEEGVVLMSSDSPDYYSSETKTYISDMYKDIKFKQALEKHLASSNSDSPQIIVMKSPAAPFRYYALTRIPETGWSVVTVLNSDYFTSLAGIVNSLPLPLTLLILLIVYAVVSSIHTSRLVFRPLARLTKSIAESDINSLKIYGFERADEIGDLSRTIRESRLRLDTTYTVLYEMNQDKEAQERLLYAVNETAAVLLLSPEDAVNFGNSIQKAMKTIGECLNIDRVCMWQTKTINNIIHYIPKYEWWNSNDEDQKSVFDSDKLRCFENSIWTEKFMHGECINESAKNLTGFEQDLLSYNKLKSVLLIPIHLHETFWGFLNFCDSRDERIFYNEEINILRSASLMMISAVEHNIQTAKINNIRERARLMLNTTPLACYLWGRDLRIHDCNDETLRIFGLTAKSEYIERFAELSPEYQDDGSLSSQAALLHIQTAFDNSKHTFQWIHQTLSGIPIPAEVTLVRVPYKNDYALAGYTRDLREHNQMMHELEKKDALLQEALEKEQEANIAKTNFLANMSHEMRTPLNAIIGLSELTITSSRLDEEAHANLIKIHNAGSTLVSTVNDILDISKIEAGKFELVPIEYALPSLINDTITQNAMRLEEKPLQFILDIEKDLPAHLYGDELRIKEILNNLLSNAYKYTRKGSIQLGIRCEREDDAVWLNVWVKDTGIGIQQEDISKLFVDYVQLDKKSNRKIQGTGLGLAITRRLVTLMDGTITVESEYGKGSVFTVRLKQKYVSDETIGPNMVQNLKNFRYNERKRRQNLHISYLNMSYARVLVVDDIITNLEVARGMLKPYRMQVDCVMSGQEAVDAIREAKVQYNAVFMDHMMPGMDGIEAVRIIREEIGSEYAKTIPIIALTANAIIGNEEKFLNAGFQAFISKPIELSRLDSVVKEWVRNMEQEKQLEERQISGGEPIQDFRSGNDRRSGIDRRIFGTNVAGLDLAKGMARFGNDREVYLDVIRSFAVSTRPLLERIRNLDTIPLSDYAVIVHGIKGSSRGIGAFPLGDKAEALEHAAKKGDHDFVADGNGDFTASLEQLLEGIEEALRGQRRENPKPKKDRPDNTALKKLLEACLNYSMSEADAAIAEIDQWEYEADDGLAMWLKENVDLMNFTELEEKLSILLSGNNEGA